MQAMAYVFECLETILEGSMDVLVLQKLWEQL